MGLPGGEGDEGNGRERIERPSDHRSGPFTREQLEALANLPSGLAEISVQEWAILLRCKADRPVEADELVYSLLDWFGTPLSASEISDFINRMAEEGFLARFAEGSAFQTTSLGIQVLEQSNRPLLKGAIWSLQHRNEEGDVYVDR